METFAQKFEQYLATDIPAKRLFEKMLKSCRREFLIGILDEVSDPFLDKKTRKSSTRVKAPILSKKSRAALSSQLRNTGRRLREAFGHPVFKMLPKSERFVELGKTLQAEAQQLQDFPLPKLGKVFSYKAYWQHVPRMGLCIRLGAPKTVSFADIERLLWFARDARGLKQKDFKGSRSLEREYKRFINSPQGQGFQREVRIRRIRRMAQLMGEY